MYINFIYMLTDILVCGDKKDSNNKVRYTTGTEPLDEAYLPVNSHLFLIYSHSYPCTPSPPLLTNWWWLANWTDYRTCGGDYSRCGCNSCYYCHIRYEMEEEGRLWLVGLNKSVFNNIIIALCSFVCLHVFMVHHIKTS